MFRRLVKNERGQSILEFALVAPLLLILMVGIFDFGRVYSTYLNMNMATQEAARIGSLGASDAEIRQMAQDKSVVDPALLEVDIDPSEGEGRKSGDYLHVQLTYPVEFFTPFVSQVGDWEITTATTIRVE